KAAVARPAVPLVVGPLPAAAHAVVARQAATIGAPLLQSRARLTRDGHAVIDDGCEITLPAPSQAQADCAAVAFDCLYALDLFANPALITQQGMRAVVLPGRLEILGREPLV